MALLKLTFLILGITLVGGAVIDNKKVKDYENFLRKSVTGTYQEPLTPELELLQNYEERSGKFQGDIVITEEQIQFMVNEYSGARNTIKLPEYHWPEALIPYTISEDHFSADQIRYIERAMDNIEMVSCVRFIPRLDEEDYVTVVGGDAGCYSYVGKVGGAQVLNLESSALNSGCFHIGTLVHELLHATGLFHQHITPNRDEWINIVWNKIQANAVPNFEKLPEELVENLFVEYDYGSILHYSEYAFSADGNRTIIPLEPTTEHIGQRYGMSHADIWRLNFMYKCFQ